MKPPLSVVKIALVAASLALSTLPALAGDTCQISYPITDGIFTHGSMICNPEWMDRRASLIMVQLTTKCRSIGEQKLKALMMRGMRDFDRKIKELGKSAACEMLDEAMKDVEHAASMRRPLQIPD